jgi:hypothetical protein
MNGRLILTFRTANSPDTLESITWPECRHKLCLLCRNACDEGGGTPPVGYCLTDAHLVQYRHFSSAESRPAMQQSTFRNAPYRGFLLHESGSGEGLIAHHYILSSSSLLTILFLSRVPSLRRCLYNHGKFHLSKISRPLSLSLSVEIPRKICERKQPAGLAEKIHWAELLLSFVF